MKKVGQITRSPSRIKGIFWSFLQKSLVAPSEALLSQPDWIESMSIEKRRDFFWPRVRRISSWTEENRLNSRKTMKSIQVQNSEFIHLPKIITARIHPWNVTQELFRTGWRTTDHLITSIISCSIEWRKEFAETSLDPNGLLFTSKRFESDESSPVPLSLSLTQIE